jgi:hypothetical protein
MERLTTRNIAGVSVYKHPFECERCGEEIWRLPDYGNGNPTEKLATYEDAEEQGLLLRLPCKVGDTIYEVSYENRKYIICEHIVSQFVYIAYRKPRIEIYCEGENGFLSSSITGQLDDGLFLNREEAEAKLKEMEGAE